MLEDLLKLLTGSEYTFAWPRVSSVHGVKCRWYFHRIKNEKGISPPKYHDTITNFPELRDRFGSIYSTWRSRRNEYGPGFYAYLATRRGIDFYEEHRFVNLISGLEALHRAKNPAQSSDAWAQKIERIVGQVTSTKDKKWLRRRLKYAHEPNLEERLVNLFSAVPIGLDESRLREFSKTCASLRDEIAHFGGRLHGSAEFVRELASKSAAVMTLYHALILHEIGIDAAILRRWVYQSFPIKFRFVEVGLLEPSVMTEDPHEGAKPVSMPT